MVDGIMIVDKDKFYKVVCPLRLTLHDDYKFHSDNSCYSLKINSIVFVLESHCNIIHGADVFDVKFLTEFGIGFRSIPAHTSYVWLTLID
jgi:hypothetical protein